MMSSGSAMYQRSIALSTMLLLWFQMYAVAQVPSAQRAVWHINNKGLPDTNTIVRAITLNNKTLFCAVFGAGVYRSADNGASWKPSNKGLKNFDIWSLYAIKDYLYAATTKGLFLSQNNAQTWIKTSVNADVHSVLLLDKATIIGSLDSIMISTDNQKTWQTTYRDNKNWFIKSLVANGNTIFAGTSGGILRSNNGGASWQATNNGFRYPTDIWAMVVSNGVVFAATADGVYQSTNNGDLWQATANRENTRSLVVANGILYAGAIGVVLRSQDNGATWGVTQEGLPNMNIWGLATVGNMLFAGTSRGIYTGDETALFGAPPKAHSSSERVIAEPLLRATAVHTLNGDLVQEEPLTKVRVEEFVSEKIHSLLNYIFFDENATYLPLRYRQFSTPQSVKDFQPERLTNRETLDVYYDMLNIIGYRMQQYTRATLTITGYNAQNGFETQAPDLSLRRAESVQRYLTSVWNISTSRLYVAFGDLPEKPSKQNDTFGDQENRRVELHSSWDILRPVQCMDTLREASPAIIRFRARILDTVNVLRWRIHVEQGGRSLRKWTGGGNSLPSSIDWQVSKRQSFVPTDTLPLQCQLEVQYKYQPKPSLSRLLSIPVESIGITNKRKNKVADIGKNKYNLILFDIGSEKVSGVNDRIVAAIRTANVFSSAATVRVLGYSDMVGADDANQVLSQRRAESVAQTLGLTVQNVRSLVVKGRGEESPLLYDNDYPEGRFYCRAVVIELDTPLKE
ncbi:MAG: hypothetical protein EAZ92_05480 [Candidatus Kapaibacterium sp.]|nr:MAG: hypothetical protein EAZ92_05480 [Candidatus Kapabacteria bacterium]